MPVITLLETKVEKSDIPKFNWESPGIRGTTYASKVDDHYILMIELFYPTCKSPEIFGRQHCSDNHLSDRLHKRAIEEIFKLGESYILYDQTNHRSF